MPIINNLLIHKYRTGLTWLRQARLPLESEKFLAQQVDQFGDDPGILELDAVDETTGYLDDLGVPDGQESGPSLGPSQG